VTRKQMVDDAVLAVKVRGYWREWLPDFEHMHPTPVAEEELHCRHCGVHFEMVRREFRRIAARETMRSTILETGEKSANRPALDIPPFLRRVELRALAVSKTSSVVRRPVPTTAHAGPPRVVAPFRDLEREAAITVERVSRPTASAS
jgi:hypothetical protein